MGRIYFSKETEWLWLFSFLTVVSLILAAPQNASASLKQCADIFRQTLPDVAWDIRSQDVVVNRNGATEHYARTDHNVETILQDQMISVVSLTQENLGRTLDAGTGGGTFVFFLSSRGVDVFGVDLTLSPAQIARPDLFSKQDILNLSFKDASFDTIFSTWSVLSYESNKLSQEPTHSTELAYKTLRELKRVLKQGGLLRISPISSSTEFQRIISEVGGLEILTIQSVPNLRADAVVLRKVD